MLALPPKNLPALPLLSAVAGVLASERAFAARVHDMFTLLHEAIKFQDGRLTCWHQPSAGSGVREQFYTAGVRHEAWREDLTRRVIDHQEALHCPIRVLTVDSAELIDPDHDLIYYGAPIIWDQQLWGVLELRAYGAQALARDEQALVGALLPLLAAAIIAEARGSGYALQRRPGELTARQSRLIEALRVELEAPLSLSALLTLLLRWALDSTGAEAGAISLVDHERSELVLQVYEGYVRDPFGRDSLGEPRRRWNWETGIAGKVARSGKPLLLRDVSRDPDFQPINPEIRAELAVPISLDGRTLAVLTLDSPRSAAFGESEVGFALALCVAAVQPLRRSLRIQELLETSTQLSQVFSSMPTGLVLLDHQGRVLRHNPAWLSVWGLGPLDLGDSFHVPLDLVPLLLARLTEPMALTDFCAAGQATPAEVLATTVRLRNPHQELQLLSVPTRDSLEQLTGRLWIVSDVTREREADRIKNEFISVVSHELRTPLTSILGYTELLLARDFAPNEQREFIQTVSNEANHLSKIVEDLLGVSRLEAGKVRLNQWVGSLRQLINELTGQLNLHLSSRHRMVIDIPPNIPPVYIDRDKVKQILFNLLTNAAKYSPRGGEIALAVEEATELPDDHPPGRFLCVSVHDEGIGIGPEDLPRIWERFYRVDNSNTRRIGGTGLGLSIARALVELHGCKIWVASTPGKGSTFFFTLPVATEMVRR